MHRFKLSSLQILKPNYRAFHQTPSRHFSKQQTPIENAGTMASHLETRSVIRFRGPDTIKFLQGLLTNDVRRLANPSRENSNTSSFPTPNVPLVSPPPLYAALLTPQGRFLYDLFLYRTPRPEEKLDSSGLCPGSGKDEEFDLFADVDASVLDEFLNCFRKYRLRSKVEIENVAKEFCCWQHFGGSVSSKTQSSEDPEAADVGYGAAVDPAAMSASEGDNAGWRWYKDPRLDILGFRGVFPCNTTPPLVETDKETNEQNYLLWRLEKGVAEGSTEISKGEAIPLEYNLVGLNAISFDKGCYVGQEFIARTHHRGVIRKRLLPLKFVNGNGKEIEQKVAPGSEVIETSSGKKVGHVNTALGSRGMGLLRLEQAVRGSGTLGIKGMDDVKIEVIRPEWWPPEWFPEHHPQNAAA